MITNYDARIRRAKELKETYPFAAEILTFYGGICAIQRRVAQELGQTLPRHVRTWAAGTLREQIEVDLALPFLKPALTELLPQSPLPLAEFMKEYLRGSQERWAGSLQRYATQGGTDEEMADSREELVARVVINPYAELLAAKQTAPAIGPALNLCPQCAARPVAGVLRVEGDGGKRFLLCSFCATEWEFRRIYCAYCGESREESLPVFVAEKFPHIRVEACDTCRHCIRSVDLTKDGHAVAVVDDLAAIPLALWADEYGYQRIHSNLLGT
jgi:formate dehydrogenase maturation protein FdhE